MSTVRGTTTRRRVQVMFRDEANIKVAGFKFSIFSGLWFYIRFLIMNYFPTNEKKLKVAWMGRQQRWRKRYRHFLESGSSKERAQNKRGRLLSNLMSTVSSARERAWREHTLGRKYLCRTFIRTNSLHIDLPLRFRTRSPQSEDKIRERKATPDISNTLACRKNKTWGIHQTMGWKENAVKGFRVRCSQRRCYSLGKGEPFNITDCGPNRSELYLSCLVRYLSIVLGV